MYHEALKCHVSVCICDDLESREDKRGVTILNCITFPVLWFLLLPVKEFKGLGHAILGNFSTV